MGAIDVALKPRLWLAARVWAIRCWVGRTIWRVYDWANTPSGGTIISRLTLLALIAVAVYVGLRIYPLTAPHPSTRPDFLDAVLESRALVFAARMTVLFAAAFVILSVTARIWNKEWLSKAGPFEVSAAVSATETIAGDHEALKQELRDAVDAFDGQSAAFTELLTAYEELEMQLKEMSNTSDIPGTIPNAGATTTGGWTWAWQRASKILLKSWNELRSLAAQRRNRR